MALTSAHAQPQSHRDALAAIFRCGAAYTERFPMLGAAFDRGALACTEEVRALSRVRAEVKYVGLDSGCAADLVDEEKSITGLLHAAAWDAHLLVSLDRDLIYTYVDLVFGGDGSKPHLAEDRPLSRIDVRIAETLLARLARSLAHGFKPCAPTTFTLDGEFGKVDLDRVGGAKAPMAVARYHLVTGAYGGEFRLAIPDAVLTALKPAFARPQVGSNGTVDPSWTQQIQGEINRTRLAISAVLDEHERPLSEIAALRVGQILQLQATPRSPIRIDCNGEPLLWCEMGQSGGLYTLRVHGFVDREQEFMDGLLLDGASSSSNP